MRTVLKDGAHDFGFDFATLTTNKHAHTVSRWLIVGSIVGKHEREVDRGRLSGVDEKVPLSLVMVMDFLCPDSA